MNCCKTCGLSEEDEFIYLVHYNNELFYTCHWCNVNILNPKYSKNIKEVVIEKELELSDCF